MYTAGDGCPCNLSNTQRIFNAPLQGEASVVVGVFVEGKLLAAADIHQGIGVHLERFSFGGKDEIFTAVATKELHLQLMFGEHPRAVESPL